MGAVSHPVVLHVVQLLRDLALPDRHISIGVVLHVHNVCHDNRTTTLLRSLTYLPYESRSQMARGEMRTAPAAIPQRVGHRPPADQRRLRCRRLRARVVSVCEHMQGLGRDASTFCWPAWCELTGPLHDGEVALRCAADPEGRGIGLAVEAVSRRLRVHAVARSHRRQTRELDERPGHTIARNS